LAGISPKINGHNTLWVLPTPNPPEAAALASALHLGPLAARVLVHRGLADPEAARRFLCPAFEDLCDPLALCDMSTAVQRLVRAIRDRERILIYGDYDVDGTTSVVLLTKAIELAGGQATYHVPHRLKDGYGMRSEVVEAAAEQNVKLIVSVDTGIRAAEVVRRTGDLGIDVIVTDHHLPESELPPALAVLNPNRPDCTYPEKNLCGAGVAFKLMQALLPAMGLPADKVRRMAESFLKIAAIATVADVVPLTGENRVIVALGLRGLNTVRNPGLRALLDGFRLHRRLHAECPPGGIPDCAAHERRRTHGYGSRGGGDVPDQRRIPRPRTRKAASRSEQRTTAGGGRNSRNLRADRSR
jgi:single-stranded-DNA-specific exonuclease